MYVHVCCSNRLGPSSTYGMLSPRLGSDLASGEIMASLAARYALRIAEAVRHRKLCNFICCESQASFLELFAGGKGEN